MTPRRLLGLDLGGTNIKTAVVEEDREGLRTIASSTAPAHAARGPDAVVRLLVELGRDAMGPHGPVDGAGIGVPGLFDRRSGVVRLLPNLPGPWTGHPLSASVSEGLGAPVTLVNDARAFTLAEGRMGAGRGRRPLVGVTLGTGVGGGILLDDTLHLGAWGVAGEIGHQTVLPEGPRCGCGNRGCVEALTQAEALARLAGRATSEDAFAGARDGDERCRKAVETAAGYLGIALANVATVLGPAAIVIGGGIATVGDLLLEPVRQAVRRRAPLVPTDELEILAAALGPVAGAVGAALAALDDHPRSSAP